MRSYRPIKVSFTAFGTVIDENYHSASSDVCFRVFGNNNNFKINLNAILYRRAKVTNYNYYNL